MNCFTTDQHGVTVVDPSADQREAILRSVLEDVDQADYPDAYLSGARGVVIGFRSDGCLLYEESGAVTRYLPNAGLRMAKDAWNHLVESDWKQLDKLDWKFID